ncbi:MAG: DNA-binding response regulator [Candidatus Viridilinea halotolerans]|uniref:DNA-binding response regulator n=1 Tax=Candidatus Viridilinea halotolerans TaxID=2491704 RepID=A0A426TWH6_9CHLR|nr:MAG: DNA-binding response regulator [Candidatus Viridilinea halotolerans]
MISQNRLLVVTGDDLERMMLEARLRGAGFSVTSVGSAESALERLAVANYALVITTIRLPAKNGTVLLREARSHDPDIEVILISHEATIETLMAALDYSAFAYLCLPIAQDLLENRVRAAIERRHMRLSRAAILRQLSGPILRTTETERPKVSGSFSVSSTLRLGALELDPMRRRAALSFRPLPLSSGEFELLHYFARHGNQVLSVEQIARDVLGVDYCSPQEARDLVKARIHRLRRKLEPDPQTPSFIISVRGAGYMLTTPPQAEQ